ncbi:MAG: hypothetical protein JXP34_16035, partial [Planctomycetes bacterium]|nr:hypothetical protein [Planctomycetota bacterium]
MTHRGWWIGVAAAAMFVAWSRSASLDADPPPGRVGRDPALLAGASRTANDAREEGLALAPADPGSRVLARACAKAATDWLGPGRAASAAPSVLAGGLALILAA